MTVKSSPPGTRKVKSHKKSRQGCGNCKLRSIKCDESKPQCKKCIAYGVICSYSGKSELQFSVEKATIISLPKPLSLWNNQTEELLAKFQVRTSLTVSTGKLQNIYQKEILRLASSNPFLKHGVLTLTLMHDRHLSSELNTRLSIPESYHWYQSLASYNTALLKPLSIDEQAALWITSAILGILAFSYIDAKTPEESWPLKPASSNDLNWLKMSYGKKEVARLTEPLQYDPTFGCLPKMEAFHVLRKIEPKITSLPLEFIKLYGLDNTADNYYKTPAMGFAKVMDLNDPIVILLSFLSFISSTTPEFKRLLELKDPPALLLLAYWYAKACQVPVWWTWRRTVMEGQAICIYLERYHFYDTTIQTLLQFPKTIFSSPGSGSSIPDYSSDDCFDSKELLINLTNI